MASGGVAPHPYRESPLVRLSREVVEVVEEISGRLSSVGLFRRGAPWILYASFKAGEDPIDNLKEFGRYIKILDRKSALCLSGRPEVFVEYLMKDLEKPSERMRFYARALGAFEKPCAALPPEKVREIWERTERLCRYPSNGGYVGGPEWPEELFWDLDHRWRSLKLPPSVREDIRRYKEVCGDYGEALD